jgi:hypothetical protein
MSSDSIEALSLQANALGHDPRKRSPWGSSIFVDKEGNAIQGSSHGLAQYFFDGDGYVITTIDGKVVHVDANREIVLLEVPPDAVGWDVRHEVSI